MNEFTSFCEVWSDHKAADCNPCFPHQATKWKKGIYSTYENHTNTNNITEEITETRQPIQLAIEQQAELIVPGTDLDLVQPRPTNNCIETAPNSSFQTTVFPKKKKPKKKVKLEALAPPLDKAQAKEKCKSNISYSVGQKVIIMNVFKNLREDNPDITISEVMRRTSKLTGCAERTIYRFRKEEESEHGLRPARSNMGKKPAWKLKYGDNERTAIKKVIYDCKSKGVVPTLHYIQQTVHANFEIGVAKTSLRTLMREMGFEYVRKKGKEYMLVEKALDAQTKNSKKKRQAKTKD